MGEAELRKEIERIYDKALKICREKNKDALKIKHKEGDIHSAMMKAKDAVNIINNTYARALRINNKDYGVELNRMFEILKDVSDREIYFNEQWDAWDKIINQLKWKEESEREKLRGIV